MNASFFTRSWFCRCERTPVVGRERAQRCSGVGTQTLEAFGSLVDEAPILGAELPSAKPKQDGAYSWSLNVVKLPKLSTNSATKVRGGTLSGSPLSKGRPDLGLTALFQP